MASLQVDVGNTRLKWRLRSSERGTTRGAMLRRDYSSNRALLDALTQLVASAVIERIQIACVGGDSVCEDLDVWAREAFQVAPEFAVVSKASYGVSVGYDTPWQLGVDRWLGVLAASAYDVDGAIVVDCGSAITLDVLRDNSHLGGYIIPGFSMMHRGLFKGTELVRGDPHLMREGFPGRNTSDAVNYGLPLMVTGFISEVLASLRKEGWWGGSLTGKLLVTGGDGRFVAEMMKARVAADFRGAIEFIEDLVLDGLDRCEYRYWPWEQAEGAH